MLSRPASPSLAAVYMPAGMMPGQLANTGGMVPQQQQPSGVGYGGMVPMNGNNGMIPVNGPGAGMTSNSPMLNMNAMNKPLGGQGPMPGGERQRCTRPRHCLPHNCLEKVPLFRPAHPDPLPWLCCRHHCYCCAVRSAAKHGRHARHDACRQRRALSGRAWPTGHAQQRHARHASARPLGPATGPAR